MSSKSNELEFATAGVPTLSVQDIIRHTIGPIIANPGVIPLCLQVYFTEGEDQYTNFCLLPMWSELVNIMVLFLDWPYCMSNNFLHT